MYSRDWFEYPTGVVIRPTGSVISTHGLAYEEVEVTRGEVRTVKGEVANRIRFRPRHVGRTIHGGGSITIDAEVDGVWRSVGVFSVTPI